jgi:group I intron endonuclease
MYIYKITNLVNQKVYIGQTVQKNPKMRWYDHQASARKGKKSPLYNSIRKHGVDKFAWEIIDSTLSVDDLNKKEAVWLDHYRNLTEVYNIREAGNNKLHSDKSILKMQESQRQAHDRRRKMMGGKEIHKSHQPHKGGWNQRRVSCLCCKKNIGINVFVAYHGNKCKSYGVIL